MGRIQVLDPHVAAKIAAGEVITRPANAVKELVENALDAGARAITVEVEEGGRRRLRVADDGCGMRREEAPLALLRHATSKITAEEDLLAVSTLGFRGEALFSIAQVSLLTLITRSRDDEMGLRLTVKGGELLETAPAAAPVGTQVTVEDLFFNTPVRRKFLKSKETEQAYVVELTRLLALSRPEVHFHLKSGERNLLAAPFAQTMLERVAALYGPELAAHLLPFALDGGPLAVHGLLSQPDFHLASSRFQVLMVNRRVVQDRILAAVLKEVYRGRLPQGRHPAAVVSLTLPPDQVDVNIHPTKREVRFRDPGRLFSLLAAALREGLGPLAGEGRLYTLSWQPAPPASAAEAGAAPLTPAAGPTPAALPQPPGSYTPELAPRPARPFLFQDLSLIGQLKGTYILAQGRDGLILIDQHAAHERVLYEELQKGGETHRQALLFPQVVEVSPRQADWVRDNLKALAQAGLTLEPFGGASFIVTAAPACLAAKDLEAVVLETVEELAPVKGANQPEAVRERARLAMACHGAIKAGQALSREEMAALLTQLDQVEVPSHCPHGRPLWRLITFGDLHQSFRRPRSQ